MPETILAPSAARIAAALRNLICSCPIFLPSAFRVWSQNVAGGWARTERGHFRPIYLEDKLVYVLQNGFGQTYPLELPEVYNRHLDVEPHSRPYPGRLE